MRARKVWFADGLSSADRLRLFESRDLVGRYFQERHGRSLSGAQAEEIISHFAQGRSYFEAADQSDVLVRPLLQYYGVLALTRALILFRSRLREAALAKKHGLAAVEWEQAFSSPAGFLAAKIRVEAGTFLQLIDAVDNAEVIEVERASGPDTPVLAKGSIPVPPETTFTFEDILARIPGVQSLFSVILGRAPHNWRVLFRTSAADLQLRIYETHGSLPSPDRLRALLRLRESDTIEETAEEFVGLGLVKEMVVRIKGASEDEWPRHLQHLRTEPGGYKYLVEPLRDEIALPSIATTFAASYALGMLVRYYPSRWMSLLGRQRGDSALPLIRAVSDGLTSFPGLVLSAL